MRTVPFMPANWFERYCEGERGRVWHEMRRLGDGVRAEQWAPDAQAVCDEMARRARHNVELLVERLTAQGHRFHENDDTQAPVSAHIPPTPDVEERIVELERLFGPIPMALVSWMRLVGDVWLVGMHPRWPDSSAADPLVIEVEQSRYPQISMLDSVADEFDVWEGESYGDPFTLPLSPDDCHKANVSGGPLYGMLLPDAGAEGTFSTNVLVPFVSYLNNAFAHGGFPGRVGDDIHWALKQELAEGLLEL